MLIFQLERLTAVKDKDFNFLDIGGGNGIFTDRILAHYPKSSGVLIDNSKYLLSKNSENPRKTVIETSAENLTGAIRNEKFDIIFMNWLLHHCVTGSFSDTLAMQRKMLAQAHQLLTDDGNLVVFENLPDGYLGEKTCSYIINRITSNKLLAPVVKKLGANTAGIGVCFLGEKQWSKQFSKTNFSVSGLKKFPNWKLNPIKKLFLTLKSMRVVLFFLTKNDTSSEKYYNPSER